MPEPRRIEMAYNNVYVSAYAGATVLVDTGPDYAGARDRLAEQLPELPGVIVATHSHHDHAGLGAWWQGRGVDVAMGAADVPEARRPHYSDDHAFAAVGAWLRQCGAPMAILEEASAAIRRRRGAVAAQRSDPRYPPRGNSPHWPTGLRYEPFEPAIALSGDCRLHHLQVLASPGHTPGNLVVADPAQGWLFSGDQLLPDITPTPGIQFVKDEGGWRRYHSLPAFVSSLRRLQEMRFERCFPGHGEPFDGVAAVIASNLAAIAARDERTLAGLRSGGPASVYTLAERMYPRALRRRFWQIAATVQGHLDSLAASGLVCEDGGEYRLT